MGWFGKLVGTDKAVDNILDKDNGLLRRFGGWVDDFNYTPEEKAKADHETREWGVRQLEALAPFKVVQRILAFASTTLWMLVGFNVVAAIWTEAFINRGEDKIKLVEPMIQFALSDYVFWPVLTVYALYFSGGVVESVKRKLGKS